MHVPVASLEQAPSPAVDLPSQAAALVEARAPRAQLFTPMEKPVVGTANDRRVEAFTRHRHKPQTSRDGGTRTSRTPSAVLAVNVQGIRRQVLTSQFPLPGLGASGSSAGRTLVAGPVAAMPSSDMTVDICILPLSVSHRLNLSSVLSF